MNSENTKDTGSGSTETAMREQKLTIYHPNNAGSGAALQIEPRFNRRNGDRYNCFFLDMAPQKSVSTNVDGKRVPATFDWTRKLTVRLDFPDICEILGVLEGRMEKAGGQRSGLYHDTGSVSTIITFQKNAEKGGYLVGLSRKGHDGGDAVRVSMMLSEMEALGLRHVLQVGLFFMLFHAHVFGASAGCHGRIGQKRTSGPESAENHSVSACSEAA